MSQTISPLGPDDIAMLDSYREWVAGHLGPDSQPGFDDLGTKLEVIQAVLDNGWATADEPVKLQALGIVFGDILSALVDAPWAMIEDEYGTDPCLVLDEEHFAVLFPMTMIAKRVEAGETVDVATLLSDAAQQVPEIRARLA